MTTASAAALALVSSVTLASCMAHETPSREHSGLIAIPEYNPPDGEAGAAASLKAAEVFLAGFDPADRVRFMYDLDAKERAGWSSLPARYAPRAGISLGELWDGQREPLFDFPAFSLSREGYRRVAEILAA